MFYSTTIKSIGNTGVVDTQGRYLRFIGDLPVKEGDTVYTDGKYIFGNAPPKGSPAIFDEPSGIPVLGDEDESGKDELRGYFTNRGKYKRYRIAGDEWIVNAEKTYAHDGSFEGIDDDNIIDAEIALDDKGNEDGVYTVEKIVDEVGEDKTTGMKYLRDGNGHIFGFSNAPEIDYLGYFLEEDTEFTTRNRLLYIQNEDADLATKDDEQVKTCEITIYKDGKEKEKIDVDNLVAPIVTTAKKYVEVEVVGREPKDHLRKRIVVDNFKIKPDGNWEVILTVEVVAERIFTAEPLILLRTGKMDKTVSTNTVPISEETTFDEETYGALAEILNGFISQFDAITRPRSITYTTFKFTVSESPNPRKFAKEVANTFAHCVYTLKIKSDEEKPETLFENVFIAPLLFFDVVSKKIDDGGKYTKSIPASHRYGEPDDPYLDGWIMSMEFDRELMTSDVLKDAGIVANSDGEFTYPQIYDLGAGFWAAGSTTYIGTDAWLGGVEERTDSLYGVYFCNIVMLYDSRNMLDAPDYENPVENLADQFSFPVQDEYSASIESSQDEDDGDEDEYDEIEQVYWKIGGVYDKNDNRVVNGSNEKFSDVKNAHQWNMSIASLKGGGYLFGIHADPDRDIDGELYKIDSTGKVEQVGDGLKNFRLREMKKINKAKK